jgi:hypothetical protein
METNYRLIVQWQEGELEKDGKPFFEHYHSLDRFMKKWDVLAYPAFDKIRGYTFVDGWLPNIDLLLLRFDELRFWKQQISQIFPEFRILPDNKSTLKKYNSLYEYFKKHYCPHPQFYRLFEMDLPHMQIFMTDQEIVELKVRTFKGGACTNLE